MRIFVKHDKSGNILSVGIPGRTVMGQIRLMADQNEFVSEIEFGNELSIHYKDHFVELMNNHLVDVKSKSPRLVPKKKIRDLRRSKK